MTAQIDTSYNRENPKRIMPVVRDNVTYVVEASATLDVAATRKTTVFLSYARGDDGENYDNLDKSLLRRLTYDLASAGFAIWWDRISLPSRSVPFSKEIEDAIRMSDRFVLVVGPYSTASEWVQAELDCALLLCKPITPILREGDFTLVPASVRNVNTVDFRLSRDYRSALDDFLMRLHEAARAGTLFGVNSLPDHYVERSAVFQEAHRALCTDAIARHTVISATRRTRATAVYGYGGVGKSTLAAALANDCAVRRHFPDGIVWLEVGQTPSPTALQSTVGATAFGDSRDNYITEQDGRVALSHILRDRAALLVLDDVWDHRIVDCFPVENSACRVLITTRSGGLAAKIDGADIRLGLLTPDEGAALIAKRIGGSPTDATYQKISEKLGGHTLAVTLAAAQIAGGYADSAVDMLRLLTKRDNLFAHLRVGEDDKNENLELSLSRSYAVLSEDMKRRFRTLGIFALEGTFDRAALAGLWGDTDEDDARGPIKTLLDANLLEESGSTISGEGKKRYRQHRLLRIYAQALLEEVQETAEVFKQYRRHYIQQALRYVAEQDYQSLFLDVSNLDVIWQHSLVNDSVDDLTETQKAVDDVLSKWRRHHDRASIIERIIQLLEAESREADINEWYIKLGAIIDADTALPLRERAIRVIDVLQHALNNPSLLTPAARIRVYRRLAGQYHNLRTGDGNDENLTRASEYYSKALNEVSTSNWERVDPATLFELARVYKLTISGERQANLRNALQLCHLILEKIEEDAEAPSRGEVLQTLGAWYRNLSDFEDALENLRKSITALQDAAEYFIRHSLLMNYAGVMVDLGLTYSRIADYTDPIGNRQQAVDAYQQALRYRTAEAAPFAQATVLSNIGYTLYRVGRLTGQIEVLQNGLLNLEEAQRIRNPETSPLGYSTVLNNLGLIYSTLAELRHPETNIEMAIKLLERALEYRDPQKQTLGNFSITATNLAAIYVQRGKLSKGEYYARKAISLTEEVRKFRDELADRRLTFATRGNAYLLLGRVLDEEEHIRKAIELFDGALEALTQADISEKYFRITGNKIEALLALPAYQEQLDAALNLCKTTLAAKNIVDFPVILIRYIELLGDCLDAIGNRSEAVLNWTQAFSNYEERNMVLDVSRVQAKLDGKVTDLA